jgi:hypothetical protein
MRFNRRHILLIIFALAIIVMFLPIKVHYSFEATSFVYPIKEWYLIRGQDDSYISELHDLRDNSVSNLKSYIFERGDSPEVQLKKGLTSNTFVKRSDTIAYIHSYFIENELIRLRNLKEVEEAALNVAKAGNKQELIDMANQKYEYAKQQLNLDKKNFNRHEKLFNDSIISQAEFEIYENLYSLAKINVQIAHNDLLSLQTGEKTEEIEYIQKKIESCSKEIRILENLQDQYYLKPPIDGFVNFRASLESIITVSDTSKYILKIPVKIQNLQYLNSITAIEFSIPGYDDKIDASFIDLEKNVNFLASQQMVIAKALINSGFHKINSGMAVQCKVICDEITIFEFLKRGIHLRF